MNKIIIIKDIIFQFKEIIIALIAVFGAIIPYLIQRKKEYTLKLVENKTAAYSEFLQDFTETALLVMHDNKIDKKKDRQRMLARNKILLYGSDEVIKAYDKWVLYADEENDHDIDKEVALFGDLLLKIRQDIVGKTSVNVDDINNLNPFYRG